MPAKRTQKTNDLLADFAAHIKASQDALGWAERAVKLREAGRTKAAQTAERNAKRSLRAAIEVETRYPRPTRESQMAQEN